MTNSTPSFMQLDDATCHCDKDPVELFADSFPSFFSPSNAFNTDFKIYVKKGTWPDFFPPVVLKYCSEILAWLLTYFVQQSLFNGTRIFPGKFKAEQERTGE